MILVPRSIASGLRPTDWVASPRPLSSASTPAVTTGYWLPRGSLRGDQHARDSAYHQGTVWPWLLGPFLTAYIRVNGGTDEARIQAAKWLEPFRNHLREAGVGQVSEILDGDLPHRPRGCIAQAWSVGELLRAAVEDVYALQPGKVGTVSELNIKGLASSA